MKNKSRIENLMFKVGVIGLGNMGSGLAKNLIKNNFSTWGYDLSKERMDYFSSIGGNTSSSVQEVAKNVEAVFINKLLNISCMSNCW